MNYYTAELCIYIVLLYKYKNEMKGDRDGKSAKTSATRNCLVQL